MQTPSSRSPAVSPTRLDIIWSAKRAIVLCAVFVGLAAGAVATLLPASYKATATIWVALPESRGVPRDSVLAANDLAAQYAQLAASLPVLRAAEATLPRGTSLAGSVSAKPVNNYNLIGVTATSGSAREAAAHANAVADALVVYLQAASVDQARTAQTAATDQLQSLDTQIAAVKAAISGQQRTAQAGGPAGAVAQSTLPGQENLLATLISQRQATINGTVGDVTGAQPTISAVNRPSNGGRQGLSPPTIGGLALVVALFLGSEGAVLGRQLRTNRRGARAAAGRGDTGLHWQRRPLPTGRTPSPRQPDGVDAPERTDTPSRVGATASRAP